MSTGRATCSRRGYRAPSRQTPWMKGKKTWGRHFRPSNRQAIADPKSHTPTRRILTDSRADVACFSLAVEKPVETWVIRKERKKCAKKKERRTALWKSGKRKKRVSHFPTGPATRDEPTIEETKNPAACGRTRSGPAGPRLQRPFTDSLLDPFIGDPRINPMVDPIRDLSLRCAFSLARLSSRHRRDGGAEKRIHGFGRVKNRRYIGVEHERNCFFRKARGESVWSCFGVVKIVVNTQLVFRPGYRSAGR
jgi:hypothetical protein